MKAVSMKAVSMKAINMKAVSMKAVSMKAVSMKAIKNVILSEAKDPCFTKIRFFASLRMTFRLE